MLKIILKKLSFKFGYLNFLYLRICKPDSYEYAEFLKSQGKFYSIGNDCLINRDVRVLNPQYTKIGNNVCLSSCTLVGHNAAVAVFNRAFDLKLDSVGKIEIGDNVFIGINATILPNVVIGSNVIVAAGAVVTKDVESGDIVGGNPAKRIGKVVDYLKKLESETATLPWRDIIKERKGSYDASIEPVLIKARQKHFFE